MDVITAIRKISAETNGYLQGMPSSGYLINMESRTDRLKSSTDVLKKLNIPTQRFIAIDGREIVAKPEYKILVDKFDDKLNPGEIGCFLSHLAIIDMASKMVPNQYTFIFEDDIASSSGNISDVLKDVEHLRPDLVYLGKCLEICSRMERVKGNLYKSVEPLCFHAYMIRNGFAKDLIAYLSQKDTWSQLDVMVRDLILQNQVKSLNVHPAIFYQDIITGGSDLRPDFLKNYLECKDSMLPCKNSLEGVLENFANPRNQVSEYFQNFNPSDAKILALILIVTILCAFLYKSVK